MSDKPGTMLSRAYDSLKLKMDLVALGTALLKLFGVLFGKKSNEQRKTELRAFAKRYNNSLIDMLGDALAKVLADDDMPGVDADTEKKYEAKLVERFKDELDKRLDSFIDKYFDDNHAT